MIYKRVQLLLFGLSFILTSCSQSLYKNVSPKSVGISTDTFKIAESKMQEYIDSGKLAGISTLVIKEGKVVQRANFGFADINTQSPILFLGFFQCQNP